MSRFLIRLATSAAVATLLAASAGAASAGCGGCACGYPYQGHYYDRVPAELYVPPRRCGVAGWPPVYRVDQGPVYTLPVVTPLAPVPEYGYPRVYPYVGHRWTVYPYVDDDFHRAHRAMEYRSHRYRPHVPPLRRLGAASEGRIAGR